MTSVCRHCGRVIIRVGGAWLAMPVGDVSGYCPNRVNDERHEPT
jgi:hypothetical protein